MRTFEIIIFALVFSALLPYLFPGLQKNKFFAYLPLAACLIIPLQMTLEGFHWQMVPIFVFTLVFIPFSLASAQKSTFLIRSKILRGLSLVLVFLAFVIALIFPLLLPVVDLPAPSGPYPVGTTNLRMTDQNRDEIFSAAPNDKRSLAVRVWYPAELAAELPTANYWDSAEVGEVYSNNADIYSFWYTHLSLVQTNSQEQAPISGQETAYPIILYSPSFYGMNTENTMLFEELASQGYIVFSIAHTYETVVSDYPDGELISGDYEYISTLFNSNADLEEQHYQDFDQTDLPAEKIALAKQILSVDEESTQMIRTRMEDLRFVLDQLEIMNDGTGIFHSKLDLNKVGVMGWSFGGAAAIEAGLTDERIQAVINIDGWPYGENFNSGMTVQQPFMLIRSEIEEDIEQVVTDLMIEQGGENTYLVKVSGASHTNFWDFPLFFKIYSYIGYWNPLDPMQVLEVEREYLVGFLDQTLKGIEVPQLETTQISPAAELEIKQP